MANAATSSMSSIFFPSRPTGEEDNEGSTVWMIHPISHIPSLGSTRENNNSNSNMIPASSTANQQESKRRSNRFQLAYRPSFASFEDDDATAAPCKVENHELRQFQAMMKDKGLLTSFAARYMMVSIQVTDSEEEEDTVKEPSSLIEATAKKRRKKTNTASKCAKCA